MSVRTVALSASIELTLFRTLSAVRFERATLLGALQAATPADGETQNRIRTNRDAAGEGAGRLTTSLDRLDPGDALGLWARLAAAEAALATIPVPGRRGHPAARRGPASRPPRRRDPGQPGLSRRPDRARALEAETAQARQAAEAQRKVGMREMADAFEHAVGGIVGMVSRSAGELQATATGMTETATRTAGQSATVAAAAGQAASNVGTVAVAAEELGASVQAIGRQVSGSAALAQAAVAEATGPRIGFRTSARRWRGSATWRR